MNPLPAPRTERDPVLVVGAGPVGLTAATELRRRGVAVRCIDKASGPSPLSKSLAVWPRAMEVLLQLGDRRLVEERSLPLRAFRYYSSNVQIADICFTDRTRPVVLVQPDVEELLRDAFATIGGRVEWGTELVALDQDTDGVKALVRYPDGTERREEFSYLVGSDGASSTVRTLLDIPFEGATYPNTFVLADVKLTAPLQHAAAHYYCSPRGVLVVVGLPSGRFRVFTSAAPDLDRDSVTLETVQRLVNERGPGSLTLYDPAWVSAFSVHARHAKRTRVGNVFLAGDAAHIHSPAGGQGLNCGITDAHNLAWKLAMVWRGRASDRLLSSYEPERRGVARTVVRQADLQTRFWLLRKRHQVALRDSAFRVASALRLANLGPVPEMAGLRTVYPPLDGLRHRSAGGFVPGGLAPDWPVWNERAGARQPLRGALTPYGYTLLIRTDRRSEVAPDVADVVDRILSSYPDLVEVRTLGADRVLHDGAIESARPGRRHVRHAPTLALIRPDHHVAMARPAGQARDIEQHLRLVLQT